MFTAFTNLGFWKVLLIVLAFWVCSGVLILLLARRRGNLEEERDLQRRHRGSRK